MGPIPRRIRSQAHARAWLEIRKHRSYARGRTHAAGAGLRAVVKRSARKIPLRGQTGPIYSARRCASRARRRRCLPSRWSDASTWPHRTAPARGCDRGAAAGSTRQGKRQSQTRTTPHLAHVAHLQLIQPVPIARPLGRLSRLPARLSSSHRAWLLRDRVPAAVDVCTVQNVTHKVKKRNRRAGSRTLV